jgi:hypothetical protein
VVLTSCSQKRRSSGNLVLLLILSWHKGTMAGLLVSSHCMSAGAAIRAVPFRTTRLAPRTLCVRASAQREEQQPGSVALLAAALAAPFLLDTGAAHAVAGEFGILEGRTAAL